MYHSIRAAAVAASFLTLAVWVGTSFAQNVNPGLVATGVGNSAMVPGGIMNSAGISMPNSYGYGVGNYGSTGVGYGSQTAPLGPMGYGSGSGNSGTAVYILNSNPPGSLGVSLSTTNSNPYPLGAYAGTFRSNGTPAVPGAAGGFHGVPLGVNAAVTRNPALFNPTTMSMNGIYATQYGPYGLATNSFQLTNSNTAIPNTIAVHTTTFGR